MKSTLAACGLVLMLAACAGTPDDPAKRERNGDPVKAAAHRPPPAPSLFISPSGQPFHAGPGEPYPVAKWFADANKAGDGKLTRAEFRADAAVFFKLLDENHDGVIDGFEVNDYEQNIAPEIIGAYSGASGDGGRRGHRPGGSPRPRGSGARPGEASAGASAVLQGAAVYSLLNEPEPVAATDVNLDGRITLAEFLATADKRFDKLDLKGLGYLTLADLPKTPAQLMGEGRYRPGVTEQRLLNAQQPN
jgi:hypothetical protein